MKTDVGQARLAAKMIAGNNTAGGVSLQLADGDIVFGYYDRKARTFTPNASSPNAVSVVANRTSTSLNGALPLFFGGIFSVNNVDLQKSAIAIADGVSAGIIILDHTAPGALTMKGSGNADKIVVLNAGVLVNSNSGSAVDATGHSMINSPDLYMVSGEDMSGHLDASGAQHKLNDFAPDPLATVPDVAYNALPVRSYPKNTVNIQPGYYPSGLPTGANLVLAPGVYAIKGDLNQNVTGDGVMFYLIDGTLGDAAINITPPTSGSYQGISIFQARNNATTCTYNGNNQVNIRGTVYMPAATLVLKGTPDGTFSEQLIVDQMDLRGTATITVNYNGFAVSTMKSFLVQ